MGISLPIVNGKNNPQKFKVMAKNPFRSVIMRNATISERIEIENNSKEIATAAEIWEAATGMEKFVFVESAELSELAKKCKRIEIADATTKDGDIYNIVKLWESDLSYKIARPYGAGFGVLLKNRDFTPEEIKAVVVGTCTQNGETVGDYVVGKDGATRLRPRLYVKVSE
jgi:homoaconitase/3-isopropylmalate dehydratase large subunit